MKLPSKTTPGASETRYFTAIDGLMDGNADVVLKETRQGKNVTAATLDVCYPAEKGSDRKDRFVANLAVNGQNLTGTTQSLGDKLPVTIKLSRKPTGDTFEFRGQITIGQTVTEVTSTDNSDLSEKEFLDNQTSDDGITPAPKDFTDVSPESIGVKVKLDAALDFLKGLKGAGGRGLTEQPCDLLRRAARRRADHQPHRRSGAVRGADRQGQVDARSGRRGMDQRHRRDGPRPSGLPPAEWRDGDKINKDKIATAISGVLSKTLAAKPADADWNANTGKLTLTFKRPSPDLSGARPHRNRRDHVRWYRRTSQAHPTA